MAEKIIIENFGPIDKIEIELRSSLILIGPQSSGKSIIAKIITICRDFSFVINRKPFLELLDKHNIKSFLTNLTYIEYNCESFVFIFKEGKEQLKFRKDHKLFKLQKEYDDMLTKSPKEDLDDHDKYLQEQKEELDRLIKIIKEESDSNNKGILIEKAENKLEEFTSNVKLFENRYKNILEIRSEILHFINYSQYIPAERSFIPMASGTFINLINNKVPLPQNILDFGSEYEKAKNKLKSIKIDLLKARFKYSENEDRVYINPKKFIKLSESSSGFQAVIPLILVIENLYPTEESGHTFVIEEPELNLYPETQKELVKFLVEKCCFSTPDSNYFNELIITTHSPYVLTAVNNLLLAFKVGKDHVEANQIIDKKYWLNPSKFNAYFISKGKAKKVFNEKTGLINDESLDSASESILYEFDSLMDLL